MTEDVEKKTYSVRLPPAMADKASRLAKLMPKGMRTRSDVIEGALAYLFAISEELKESMEIQDGDTNSIDGGRGHAE